MPRMTRIGKTATKVFESGEWTCVQYHDTVVLKFTHDAIVLNSGGWHTLTTKTRINQAANQFGLGLNVSQKKGCWYVAVSGGLELPFMDGMCLSRQYVSSILESAGGN